MAEQQCESDRMVAQILREDEARLGNHFYDCEGIDSSTGEVVRFNSRSLEQEPSTNEDESREGEAIPSNPIRRR